MYIIKTVKGDITKITDVQAIVNAANNSLLGGGGVDGAIHRAAGPELLAECRTLHGCETGEAKITKAYNLPCDYVIHTVGPIWNGGTSREDELLANCYYNSMKLAMDNGIRNIAFPSISTGVYSFPVELAAKIAVNTINRFLQENPDNMMYLDYPNLESYKVEAKTENGNPFYRDTFLEEFLSEQHLTEKLSDMEGVWTDYVKYVDSISGATKDIQKQIEIFAQNRDKWAVDIDFANEQYKFTLADLDMDGQVELLVSHCGGTGIFSYTSFYKVDKDGKLKELDTTFSEYESQPDLMDSVSDESDVTVYSNIINGKGCYNYIVYDFMKESPDCYIYRVSSLAIVDDVVTETKLAIEYETYEDPDYEATISYEDYNGTELTEDEYRTYAARYYEAQQASEHRAHFKWIDVSDIVGVSDSEAAQILMESYDAYSFH